ncbi:hypothetical protein FF1_030567 [Malus domestica]
MGRPCQDEVHMESCNGNDEDPPIFWAIPMTHMEANIFPEPSKIDPNRFGNQASTPPYSFAPFGRGPQKMSGI